MTATMHMLIEHWGKRVLHAPRNGEARFSWVALIDPDGMRDDGAPAPVERDTLYCADEETCIAFLERHPSACGIGVGDGSRLDGASEGCRHRIVVLKDDQPFASLFEDVRRYLLKYERWTERMRGVLFEGGDYQSLLDCSAGMFEDFVSITDSSFRLLAYTKDVPVDDPVVRHLIEKGYHAKETVDAFKKHGALKRWQTQTGIVRLERTLIVGNPTLSYVFRMQGNYFVHVVLQCTRNPITEALVDTFQILVDHLELFVRHDWASQHRFNKDYAALLRDLVMRRPQNEEFLRKRLLQAGIACEGSFALCVMEVEAEDEEGQRVLGYYAWRLLEAVPLGKASIFQGRLLLLVSGEAFAGAAAGREADLLARLEAFQGTFGGVFGVSDWFSCIKDLPFAYRQARLAIDYGQKGAKTLAARCALDNPEGSVHVFRRHYPAYVYEHGSQDAAFVEYCARKSAVADIARFDREQGTDDARMLYCYLLSERRAKEAAEMLHLHRNTLVYRIERLQKRYGLDLARADVREEVLLAFRTLPDGLAR